MGVTFKSLADCIVHVYPRRGNTLMSPCFGAVVRRNNRCFVLTVAHSRNQDEVLEVWSSMHPEVANSLRCKTASQRLIHNDAIELGKPHELDCLALPIAEYNGDAFESVALMAGLFTPAMIACLDYEPADGVLRKTLDGQAGLVERENETELRLSAIGRKGMSGSPVVIEHKHGGIQLLGLYTGTPRTTPVTVTNISEHSRVVKVANLLSML